jgi:hypothetical protein
MLTRRRHPRYWSHMAMASLLGGFMGGGGQKLWDEMFTMAPLVLNRISGSVAIHSIPTEPTGVALPRQTESEHGIGVQK